MELKNAVKMIKSIETFANAITAEVSIDDLLVLSEVNQNVSGWQKFYVGLFESTLLNREINIYIFTIILNILFITIRSYLCIVVEVLFIVNIFPTLYDIFKAIKSKYLHIIMVLLFDFLTEYVFMWFGFFFFQDFFKYDDILEPTTGDLISENYCY